MRRMTEHLLIRFVARDFADPGVFANVAAPELLECTDEPFGDVERANHDAAYDAEVFDDLATGDFIAGGYKDLSSMFDAFSIRSVRHK